MNELIFPSLHLFTYNLRRTLGVGEEGIEKNHQEFWNNFPADFPENLKVSLEKEHEYEKEHKYKRIDLLTLVDSQALAYPFKKSIHCIKKVEGFYYPVRLSDDTYSLQFNCSIDNKIKPQPISYFKELKALAPTNLGTLGKTWMLCGFLSSAQSDSEAIAIAKSIYLAFSGYSTKVHPAEKDGIVRAWENRKSGEFLGATIFEVWHSPEQGKNVEDNFHVLIILYPDSNNIEMKDKKAADFYEYWMDLFCFRNKIIWAYCEAQNHKKWLNDNFFLFKKASPEIQDLFLATDSKRLTTEQLQAALRSNFTTHAQYSLRLNLLQLQSETIEINVDNYKKCLNRLIQEASPMGDTNLKFLNDFSCIIAKRYQTQVNKDYGSLSPNLAVRETLTETLTGFVQIEQTERDRRLEDIIAIIGVGVGTASVFASVASALVKDFTQFYPIKVDKDQLPFAEPLSNLLVVLLLSIGLGYVAGWATWKYWPHRRRSTRPR